MISDVVKLKLADVCSDLFLFAFRMREVMGEETDAERVQRDVDEIFQNMETAAHQAGIPLEDVHQAKYALAAYLDETVLNSDLPCRGSWAQQPLQLKYFDDSAAGEEFFNRLDNLRHAPEAKLSSSLDVFLLCMVLGFKGMYIDAQGQEKRSVLIHKLAQDIESSGDAAGEDFLPEAGAVESRARPRKPLPVWVLPAACTLILVLLYFVFTFWLDHSVNTFFDVFPS